MAINPAEVLSILADSQYTPEEWDPETEPIPPEAVVIKCALNKKCVFHPTRLESHRAEVVAMLAQLHNRFKQSKNTKGWTLFDMNKDATGAKWSDVSTAHRLGCLAIGLEEAEWVGLEFKDTLPGGLPYFLYLDGEQSSGSGIGDQYEWSSQGIVTIANNMSNVVGSGNIESGTMDVWVVCGVENNQPYAVAIFCVIVDTGTISGTGNPAVGDGLLVSDRNISCRTVNVVDSYYEVQVTNSTGYESRFRAFKLASVTTG